MSVVLSVSLREKVGQKGALRSQRASGFVPGVVYGAKKDPVPISFSAKELKKAISQSSFQSHVHTLSFEDGAQEKVLLRDAFFHPVTDALHHIDFLRVEKGARVHVTLPISFKDEALCLGIKRGGILNVVVHALDVSALVEDIPEGFEISLKDKQVGDSIHLSDLNVASSIKVLKLKESATIATVAAPSGMVDEEGKTSDADDSANA